jgi:hypothetical protein
MDLSVVVSFRLMWVYRSLRGYDGAEPSSLDDDVAIAVSADICDLLTDMFPFSITIRPDHDHISTSCFLL